MINGINYSEAKISKTLRGIYRGEINAENLPKDLYLATADHLKSGAYKGFGFDLQTAKGKKLAKLLDLRENLYLFSGAKTYQQTSHIVSLIRDDNGTIKPFNKFRDDVLPIFDQYNNVYLRTEHQTAIGQSQIAEQWETIESTKDFLPLLKYSALEGSTTCDICRPLDGIVLPVTSSFWDKFMPLNHFGCFCIVTQHSEDEETITSKSHVAKLSKGALEKMNPLFQQNAGKTGEIFTKDHPYFDVPAKDKAFAKRNFDLPLPEKD